jgi:hypothetical protein
MFFHFIIIKIIFSFNFLFALPGMSGSDKKGSVEHLEHLHLLLVETVAVLGGGPDVAWHLQVPEEIQNSI